MAIPATQWPLHAALHIARPSLERVADDFENGIPVRMPLRAGPFVVREVERRGDAICLWTDPSSGGKAGLVRCRPGQRGSFNIWWEDSLSDDWRLIYED